LGQYGKKQSNTDIFRIGPISVGPITARSESARRFDNRKEKSREILDWLINLIKVSLRDVFQIGLVIGPRFDVLAFRCASSLGPVFKAIFNNISVISWRSVLLVEETRHELAEIILYLIKMRYTV
jgi:hypothetical protein